MGINERPALALPGAEHHIEILKRSLEDNPTGLLGMLASGRTPEGLLGLNRRYGPNLDTLQILPEQPTIDGTPIEALALSGIVRRLLLNQHMRGNNSPTPDSWLDFDDDTWNAIEADPAFTEARSELQRLPADSNRLPLALTRVALAQLQVYSNRYTAAAQPIQPQSSEQVA